MYRLSELQAVEPDTLPAREGVVVEVHDDLDWMGLPRVDIVAESRDDLIAYVREAWGDDDEAWFAEYVVARVTEYPIDYAEYIGRKESS